MIWRIRDPRVTESSRRTSSAGMRRILILPPRPWRMNGMARLSAIRVAFRSSSVPMTLTHTRAWARSGVVSTLVTVTKQMRGSATSRSSAWLISWRSSASILSVRWVIGTGSSIDSAPVGGATQDASTGRPAHHLLSEALDDVTLDQIVRPREADAALEVGCDFPDIVLHAAEAFDPVGGDHLSTAPDANAAAANDATVGDVATGNDRGLADPEDLANLGPALDCLDFHRLEQAAEGSLDIVGELVDDVVLADVDFLRLGGPAGRVGHLGAEGDDDRIRCRGKHDVVVGDVAGSLVENVDADFVRRELL